MRAQVRLVDLAFNRADITLEEEVVLDVEGPVPSDLDLGFPPGKTHFRADELVRFSARAEIDAVVLSAELLRANGVSVAVSADAANDAGAISGTLRTPSAASLIDGAELSLRLTLADSLGNEGSASLSAPVDLVPPTIAVAASPRAQTPRCL